MNTSGPAKALEAATEFERWQQECRRKMAESDRREAEIRARSNGRPQLTGNSIGVQAGRTMIFESDFRSPPMEDPDIRNRMARSA